MLNNKEITMNTKNYEYTPRIVLQTRKDDECWVIGVLLKRTAKRFYVYDATLEKAAYYKHIKFENLDNYPYWEETMNKAKEIK